MGFDGSPEKASRSFSQLRKTFRLNLNTLAYQLRVPVLPDALDDPSHARSVRGNWTWRGRIRRGSREREFSNYHPTELGQLSAKNVDDHTR